MLYFTSDTHFFHNNIMKYCANTRPYSDLTEMHAAIITNWNNTVGPTDTVYVAGDFAFAEKKDYGILTDIFESLNGFKHFVTGNHDYQNKKVFDLPWESVNQIRKLHYTSEVDNQKYVFIICHYPMETWEGAQKGYLHLHGHCHGTLERVIPHRYDIGIDGPYGPTPINAETLIEISKGEDYKPQDHHGKPQEKE